MEVEENVNADFWVQSAEDTVEEQLSRKQVVHQIFPANPMQKCLASGTDAAANSWRNRGESEPLPGGISSVLRAAKSMGALHRYGKNPYYQAA